MYLDFGLLIDLYWAFPEFKGYWISSWFPKLFRLPVINLKGRSVELTTDYGPISFSDFVNVVHFYRHSCYEYYEPRKFVTEFLKFYRLQPTPIFTKTYCCVFFPPWAPEPFQNGFAMSDDSRRLHLFAAQEYEFRLICLIRMGRPVMKMAISPDGETLALVEGQTLTVVQVSAWSVKLCRTEHLITVDNFREDAFITNRCFLSSQPSTGGTIAAFNCQDFPTISRGPFCTLPEEDMVADLFQHVFRRGHKVDTLIYQKRVGLPHLEFLSDPRGERRWSYVCLEFGTIERWGLDIDRNKLYLVVITPILLEDFIGEVDLPVARPEMMAQCVTGHGNFTGYTGHIVIYEGNFEEDGRPVFRPRFYLGPRSDHPEGLTEWCARHPSWPQWETPFVVNTNFLIVRVDTKTVAFCNLFVTATSPVTYHPIQSDLFRVFACSRAGSYCIFYPFSFQSLERGESLAPVLEP